MIKGRSKGGPQKERGRKEMKEINGVDGEDRRMRISTITISHRVINNKQTKRYVLPFRKRHREGKDRQMFKERYR